MPRIKKTILVIEVDDQNYNVSYTGSLVRTDVKEFEKHDLRLMRLLAENDVMLDFFRRIVEPIADMKRKERR